MATDKTHIAYLWRARMEVRGDKINLPAACNRAMRLIAKGDLARESISARTGLSVKGVEVVQGAMSKNGATADKGWKSLPDAAKFSLIKSDYYKTPTKDTWIMARLLADGATNPGSAVRMPEDRNMRDLVGWGHVCKTSAGEFYLVGLGPEIAQGVLSMYPEIGEPSFSKSGGLGRRVRKVAREIALMPPPRINSRRGGVHSR